MAGRGQSVEIEKPDYRPNDSSRGETALFARETVDSQVVF